MEVPQDIGIKRTKEAIKRGIDYNQANDIHDTAQAVNKGIKEYTKGLTTQKLISEKKFNGVSLIEGQVEE